MPPKRTLYITVYLELRHFLPKDNFLRSKSQSLQMQLPAISPELPSLVLLKLIHQFLLISFHGVNKIYHLTHLLHQQLITLYYLFEM